MELHCSLTLDFGIGCTGYVGDGETAASAGAESTLGYHSSNAEVLTRIAGTRLGTLSGGQFDWGGRLQKRNGGVQRSAQRGRKSRIEYKRISRPNCETYKSSSNESRS